MLEQQPTGLEIRDERGVSFLEENSSDEGYVCVEVPVGATRL